MEKLRLWLDAQAAPTDRGHETKAIEEGGMIQTRKWWNPVEVDLTPERKNKGDVLEILTSAGGQ